MPFTEYIDREQVITNETIEKVIVNSHEGIAIVGNDRKIEYVNDKVCLLLGRTHEEILGHDFREFVHKESSVNVTNRFASRLGGESLPFEYEATILNAQNESRNVRIRTCVLSNWENKTKILAQVLDITDEKKVRCALSECKLMYQTLVQTMNEGLGIIDDKGVLTYANTALCAMLGYTDGELVGKSTTSFLYGLTSDFVFEKIKERITGKTGRYESILLHKSGRMIPTMISASPLRDHDGEYVGSFAVFTDITNQKSAEKGMQNARNRALLYRDIMGHDIRNQLQQIQVEAELLLSSIIDEKARKRLESILQAVSQSAAIISETRSIEQLAEMPLCERLLDSVLHECVMAAIVLLDHVDFRLSIQVSDARVMADSYLELLISDLLEETCRHSLSDQINVSLTQAESDYLLCISSNGPKMPVDIKDNLMGTSQRSVGLCFHLVRQIIQKYGANVKIRDILNEDSSEGSMIILTFPRL